MVDDSIKFGHYDKLNNPSNGQCITQQQLEYMRNTFRMEAKGLVQNEYVAEALWLLFDLILMRCLCALLLSGVYTSSLRRKTAQRNVFMSRFEVDSE